MKGRRKEQDISVPPGTVVPEGFVLVTSRSWHGLQLALRVLLIGIFLSAASWFIVQLQLASRNDNIQTTQDTTARLERQVAKLQHIAGDAQKAAEAGTTALKAAIASSSGGGEDLQTRSAVAVDQIRSICYQTAGRAECDQVEKETRARILAATPTTTTTTTRR